MKICLNCGDKLLEAAKKCPHCGTKDGLNGLIFPIVDRKDFSTIEKIISEVPNPKDKNTGSVWEEKLNLKSLSFKEAFSASIKNNVAETVKEKELLKERIKQMDRDGIAYCPKCYSSSLSAHKKGFGIGKAIIGAGLTASLGGIGAIGGNLGAKKVRVTCLKCGHQFWAGKK